MRVCWRVSVRRRSASALVKRRTAARVCAPVLGAGGRVHRGRAGRRELRRSADRSLDTVDDDVSLLLGVRPDLQQGASRAASNTVSACG